MLCGNRIIFYPNRANRNRTSIFIFWRMSGMKEHLRFIGLSNELTAADRPLVIPYGSYPHKVGRVTQLINSKTAAMMVDEFMTASVKDGFRGLPVYIGHPDVKSFRDKYQDHRAYGWVVDMIANDADRKLELTVEWNEPGRQLLTNEHFAYFSPNWLAVKGGAGEALPFKMISVGLTHTPMIEYLALACEDGGDDQEIINQGDSMNKLLERLKALLPEKVQENVKTEDELVSIFQKMLEGLKALRDSQQERWKAEDAAYMALENEDPVAGLAAYLGVLAEANAAELQLANETVPESATATIEQLSAEMELANEALAARESRLKNVLLDVALADGRITPATRGKWESRFAAEDADFEALANELDSIDPIMKTGSVTKGKRPESNIAATHADLRRAATQLANEKSMSYETAYASLKSTDEFAHLFPAEQADAQ
ncbi:hypothetical protein EGM51_10660 [Verrucomicrobia bacterium S94]|nr:hypothetical protein EGM51_10660 [Verrucomicrobia bacterium S94]